jgi:hypothetical protein
MSFPVEISKLMSAEFLPRPIFLPRIHAASPVSLTQRFSL